MICALHADSMHDRLIDPAEVCGFCSIAKQINALQERNARLVEQVEKLKSEYNDVFWEKTHWKVQFDMARARESDERTRRCAEASISPDKEAEAGK